jgi:hypothetical protein
MTDSPAYLVVYDWACGQLVSAEEYPSRGMAEAARDLVAHELRDDPSIEISVREEPPAGAIPTRSFRGAST